MFPFSTLSSAPLLPRPDALPARCLRCGFHQAPHRAISGRGVGFVEQIDEFVERLGRSENLHRAIAVASPPSSSCTASWTGNAPDATVGMRVDDRPGGAAEGIDENGELRAAFHRAVAP